MRRSPGVADEIDYIIALRDILDFSASMLNRMVAGIYING